jgi:hypothetical protein
LSFVEVNGTPVCTLFKDALQERGGGVSIESGNKEKEESEEERGKEGRRGRTTNLELVGAGESGQGDGADNVARLDCEVLEGADLVRCEMGDESEPPSWAK